MEYNKGFSLLELIVALSILVVAVLGGVFSVFHASGEARNAAEETLLAMYELESALEDIRSIPFTHLTDPKFPDSLEQGEELKYYSDLSARKAANPDFTLPLKNQKIIFEYVGDSTPASGQKYPPPGTDPLEIRLTIQWTPRGPRQMTRTEYLWTKLTK